MSFIDNTRVFAAAEIGTLYRDDERSIVEKYGHLCAPFFRIEISDKDDNRLFSAEALLSDGGFDLNGLIIHDVSYDEDIDGAASVSLSANNPTLELLNSNLFMLGNNIDVWMGYDGRTPFYMGRGIVVELNPELPAAAMPMIRLTAYDISHFMMEEGKGEIVPEGSAWWERGRIQRTAQQPEPEVANDSYEDDELSGEDIEDIEADNERSNLAGEEYEQQTINNRQARELGYQPELEEVHGVLIPADGSYAAPSQVQTRTGWQQQNLARRRRQAGKVWRNLTDAEIVAKIFLSYGITPYVEATRESVRRSTRRNRPIANAPNPSSIVAVDEDDLNDLTDEQLRRLELAARDDETLEDARTRLGDTVNDWTETGADGILNVSPDLSPEGNERFYRSDEGQSDRQYLPTRFVDPANAEVIEDPFGDYWGTFGETPYQHDIPLTDNTPPQMPTRTGEGGDRTVTQKAGTTDWDFLKELAAKHGFILFVFFHIESRRWIGYWGPESNVPQFRQYIFKYNAGDLTTLGDIRPNVSSKSQTSEIDLIFTDPASRRENRLRVSMDGLSEYTSEFRGESGPRSINDPIGDGPEVVLAVYGQRTRVRADHQFTSAEDARIWLMSYWMRHAEDFALLQGNTIVGIPEMRAREHHEFQGLECYSGSYFVTQARHAMSPNSMYTTEFTARRASTLQPGDENSDAMTVDQREIGTNTPGEAEELVV